MAHLHIGSVKFHWRAMDFTVVKLNEKLLPYQLSNFVSWGLKFLTFGYMVALTLKGWTFVACCYMCLVFYWIINLDAGMRKINHELTKRKAGKRYHNLVKLTFSNPQIGFYYKLLYLLVFLILYKIASSIIGSLNLVKIENSTKLQYMLDSGVSIEEVY